MLKIKDSLTAMVNWIWRKAEAEPTGRVMVKRETTFSEYTVERAGGSLFYTLVSRSDGLADGLGKRHKAMRGFPFSKSLAAGLVYVPIN